MRPEGTGRGGVHLCPRFGNSENLNRYTRRMRAIRPAHRRERTQWDKTVRRIARHRKIQAFFLEVRTLRLAGGALVGVYGAFALFATVLAVLGIASGYRGAELLLLVGGCCVVVAAFGVWVFRSAR